MIVPLPRGMFRLVTKTVCAPIALLALFLCSPVHSYAATDVLTIPMEDTKEASWNLEADKLVTLSDNTIVEAQGGVVLQRGNDILKADFARYYSATNWVYLKGNVFVRMGKDDIHSDEAEFDLHSKTGWLTNGHVFMEGPHIYFSGSRIIKHWGDRYTFNKAKVTTCDGTSPAWSMNAEQAVVEIDGYAQLFHSTFDVKNTIELRGKKIGIIGLGQTGYNTARIAIGFGMEVHAYTSKSPFQLPPEIKKTELDELFANCDIISLHCPLTDSTRELINAARLKQMKPNAILINTGRGPLINEQDLADALNNGTIFAAGLDVLSQEPPRADNPLLTARNCYITPHIAWASAAARERLMQIMLDNVKAFLDGKPINSVIK